MFKDDLGYTLLGAGAIGTVAAGVIGLGIALTGSGSVEAHTTANTETVIKEVVVEKPVEVLVDNPQLVKENKQLKDQIKDLQAQLALANKQKDSVKVASLAKELNGLKLEGVRFGVDKMFGVSGQIQLDLTNTTDKEVVAYKVNFQCNDAFGDKAFAMNLTSKSANIPAGQSDTGSWEPNMFGNAADILKNNDAKNFDCGFNSVQVVNK